MINSVLRSSLLGACLVAASAASAQVLFTSEGFESPAYSAGPLAGQHAWVSDAGAAWEVGAFGVGGTQGVRVPSGINDWSYVPLGFSPTPGADKLSVKVDIARTVGGTSPSFGYAVDVYDSSLSRVGRVGLTTAGGVVRTFLTSRWDGANFNPAGSVTSLMFGSPFASGEFVNFELVFDFSVKEFAVTVNGSYFGSVPFVTVGAVDVGDVDLHVSSNSGAADQGFFDNLFIAAVPEPSTWAAIVGALSLGVAVVARRRAS